MYHGTHKSRLNDILQNGLKAGQHGVVSLAYDANVAKGYASMSGEAAFRAAGSKAKHVPMRDRIVFIVRVPEGAETKVCGSGLLPKHELAVTGDIGPEYIVGVFCPL